MKGKDLVRAFCWLSVWEEESPRPPPSSRETPRETQDPGSDRGPENLRPQRISETGKCPRLPYGRTKRVLWSKQRPGEIGFRSKSYLFVFDYLREQEVSEPDIEKRISYLTRCVNDFSGSWQAGYNFFKNP